MDHIIELLPDSIANQIAAGEVVQRPASVVKELLENAVDAGASHVEVVIKNAGKTLIQVSDDGCGMSAQDARMCFERHATSKIRRAEDLFGIRTLGFRGEALASIAAVAQVRLRTRLHNEEIGTELEIAGSELKSQKACVCPPGSSFAVKNLFFNVPARRNFLKSNPVEMRHIVQEFIRVAIPNPHIHFSLIHNDTPVFQLPPAKLEQRLVDIWGKDMQGKLKRIEESTGYVTISGFIADPEIYKKSRGDQYFFVNKRFIKSPYLHHAISTAYQDFIPDKKHPVYCVFLELDPVHVDINIHPTKTEVKFDDERTIYVLLHSMVKRGLGEHVQSPTLDFEQNQIKEAIYSSTSKPPSEVTVGSFKFGTAAREKPQFRKEDWEQLYQPATPSQQLSPTQLFGTEKLPKTTAESHTFWVRFHHGYILTQAADKLYIIHQQLAHQRVLFEKFLKLKAGGKLASQTLLFPQTIELSPVDFLAFKEAEPTLLAMGFEIKEFGTNTLIVYATPAEIPTGKICDIIEQMVADIQEMGKAQFREKLYESIARAVAMRSAVSMQQQLGQEEMKKLVKDLFKCEAPGYSPKGKPTYKEISVLELEKYFG
ncbi:MAG: DNA mismatch repair endonuclease MutL [Bacteroidetes bacterium]|nr:MAG: DNA mismatch repair endonuclease MutL [Bacteroidota bacterium]